MLTYGIYRQRSHDAILVNRVRSASYAKRQARELARSGLEQFFVDEEHWLDPLTGRERSLTPVKRVRLYQTPVGRYTEPTPGVEQHGRYRFDRGA